MAGTNDVYGVGEREAAGSALIEAYERGVQPRRLAPLHERMRIASCRLCGCLLWIARPPDEKTWRAGGKALIAECALEFSRRLGS
jgi:hypothetical protein